MDRIRFLPGASRLLSHQYSGFLDITLERHMHYYYIESEHDPEKDSIIFWTNGGPGCSGFLGLFSEMGPWRPTDDGNLIANPYSWSKMANMVFLEQPVGVGYSYDDRDPTPDSIPNDENENQVKGDVPFGDYHAVSDMISAMVVFFEKYPERLKNKIYIASESYGGHYIPELTLGLLNKLIPPSIAAKKPLLNGIGNLTMNATESIADIHVNTSANVNSSTSVGVNSYYQSLSILQSLHDRFSGYILGNPYVSFASGEIAGALTAWGYQILPKSLWDRFKGNDCHLLTSDAYTYSDICWNLLYEIDDQIMEGGGLLNAGVNSSQKVANSALIDHGLNIYALDFPTCPNGTGIDSSVSARVSASSLSKAQQIRMSNSKSTQALLLKKMIHRFKSARSKNKNKYNSKNRRNSDLEGVVGVGGPGKVEMEIESEIESHTTSTTTSFAQRVLREHSHSLPISDALLDYNPCTAFNAVGYLNRQDVKLALNLYHYESITVNNVSTPKLVLLDRNWTMCNNKIFNQWPLADMFSDTVPLYKEIHDRVVLKSEMAPNEASKEHWDAFKMLIFSGDADGVCATVGTQDWVYNVTGQMITTSTNSTSNSSDMQYDTFKDSTISSTDANFNTTNSTSISAFETLWQPWNSYGQRAGSISLLSNHLAFVTVHDAGHEVPAYQPARALVLLGHYLNGELYDKNSDLLQGPNTGINRESKNDTVLQPVDPVISDIIVLLISLIGSLTFLMFFCRVKTTKRRVIDNMDDSITIEMGRGMHNANDLDDISSNISDVDRARNTTNILKFVSEEVEDVK